MDLLQSKLKIPSPLEEISPSWIVNSGYQLFIKRDDLIHPHICGNKWRKLKYNFHQVLKEGCVTVISFGGAFSNHLVALAASSYYLNIKSVGIIGSHSSDINNATVKILKSYGMELYFVPPQEYRLKENAGEIQEILAKYPGHFLIPEGGSNKFAVAGVVELANEITMVGHDFNSIFCGIGTGGTVAGLVEGLCGESIKIFAVSPFKYNNMKFAGLENVEPSKLKMLDIVPSYLLSKFASYNIELVQFMNTFFEETNILLDPVYTAKTMITLKSYVDNRSLSPGSKILFIHTGGLQGIEGFKNRFGCEILT